MTLIELLLVSSIVGLVLIGVMFGYRMQVIHGYDAKRKSDLSRIKNALEEYYSDYNCYPTSTILSVCDGNALQPYLPSIPCDPVTKVAYKYVLLDDSNPCKGYKVFAKLQDPNDGDIKAQGCQGVWGCGYGTGWNYGISSGDKVTATGFNPNTSPTPTPVYQPGSYACTPGGSCNSYIAPAINSCPITFLYANCYDPNNCLNQTYRCTQ